MRLPGTLKALLAQVKASPVPLGSISIPLAHGVLMLTFGDAPKVAPPPRAEENRLTARKPLRERDTIGAFRQPPVTREDPWQAPGET